MCIRIIPCLDIMKGRVVKGVKFTDLKDAGDPLEIARVYDRCGADELFLLDVAASKQNRRATLNIIESITEDIHIPLTVGGGVTRIEDFKDFIEAGATKVSIGSGAIKNPQLICEAAEKFGSQRIVIAIDAKKTSEGNWSVYIKGGKLDTGRDAVDWAMEVNALGAGQILLTSMDRDGTKEGYDIELLKAVSNAVDIPIIASGGAGKPEHFLDAAGIKGIGGLLAASLFHFGEIEIGKLKEYLKENGVKVG